MYYSDLFLCFCKDGKSYDMISSVPLCLSWLDENVRVRVLLTASDRVPKCCVKL